MKDITCFSANVVANFDNSYDNMLEFNELLLNTAHNVYEKYTKEEANKIIRTQFDRIMGGNYAQMTPMQRRQAMRAHGCEWASLVEEVIADRMNSGWDSSNAAFMDLVREINLADGDKNEIYVDDNSLLQVSVFAGNHHDIIRQAAKPGKSYTIDTSWYTVKVYADFELFRLGKIDFAGLVEKIYKSIEKNRYDALYVAFLGLDKSLPTDLILETPVADTTKDDIVAHAELIRSTTGKDVMFVGTKVALTKLQSTVNYNLWSDSMKDEKNKNGLLGSWEGYTCLALPRVNASGTRKEITDNTKIYIVPMDSEFKPIVRVNEGDVMYYETGMDGLKKDMTVDVEVSYKEGIGIVINEDFGVIKIEAN